MLLWRKELEVDLQATSVEDDAKKFLCRQDGMWHKETTRAINLPVQGNMHEYKACITRAYCQPPEILLLLLHVTLSKTNHSSFANNSFLFNPAYNHLENL